MRRRLLAGALAASALVCSLGAPLGASTTGSDALQASSLQTRVSRVVDGDTIRIDGGQLVRLIGVDTPEVQGPYRDAECFGEQASQHTEGLLPPRTDVRLVFDVGHRDRYDRLLAYVYRSSDDLFVNASLVRNGYANVLTIPPNVRYAARFRRLERAARAAGRGLWSAC
jgi:micrococcal nuclease